MATTRDYGRDMHPPNYGQDLYPPGDGQDLYSADYEQNQYPAGYEQDQQPAGYEQDQYPAGYEQDQQPVGYEQDLYPTGGRAQRAKEEFRAPKRGMDEWMAGNIKLGGTGIKRKTAALLLLGCWGFLPLFFMLPSLLTFNTNTIGGSVDDTLGTGAMVNLFMCLLITPTVTLTGLRWFVPLRRWYGIMFACCGIGDALGAALFDDFAGNPFAKLVEHTFTLIGFTMVLLAIPLFITSNNWAQRKMGRYWKRLQMLTYVIWGLLFFHLATLEGFGFERGSNGSGFAGDGDPIFHQRLYQYCACSVFLLTLRLPPVKRWITARQQEGRNGLVAIAVAPIFALFLFGFIFIVNELIFKGTHSFVENPSVE